MLHYTLPLSSWSWCYGCVVIRDLPLPFRILKMPGPRIYAGASVDSPQDSLSAACSTERGPAAPP